MDRITSDGNKCCKENSKGDVQGKSLSKVVREGDASEILGHSW